MDNVLPDFPKKNHPHIIAVLLIIIIVSIVYIVYAILGQKYSPIDIDKPINSSLEQNTNDRIVLTEEEIKNKETIIKNGDYTRIELSPEEAKEKLLQISNIK